ncbi:MAG TPA: phosphoribosylformylglycinamidine cyclo-ligase [Candidatus Nitrosopolaris sp.]|nr:phosphoribosylformylglycinamidine cyclo-ligase [Candidatus Nitrosopolaris sp.]
MRNKSKATYANSGIDIKAIFEAKKKIGAMISGTHLLPLAGKVLSGYGGYAGLIDLGGMVLALHADGVGSKIIVAQMMNRFDTIGVDCIAMNVNDVICVGAQPLGFIDYIALKSANKILLQQIVKGLVEGAKESNVPIVGGETAVLPDLISGFDDGNAFDLAGMILGSVARKSDLVLGQRISVGDVILGVESSGLHSNGYTLARKVLLSKYSLDKIPEHMLRPLGEELLTPTRVYVRPIIEILNCRKSTPIHGLAHITGGSFTKLARLNKRVRYMLNNLPPVEGIFRQIKVEGRVDMNEMYRTFNMGIGFCVILPKNSVDKVFSIFEKYRMRCIQIGTVDKKGSGNVIVRLNGKNNVL